MNENKNEAAAKPVPGAGRNAQPGSSENRTPAAPVVAEGLTDNQESALHDVMVELLDDLYVCGRTWSAWGVGTMSEDDFSIASQDDDLVQNFVNAASAAIAAHPLAAPAAPTGAKADEPDDPDMLWDSEDAENCYGDGPEDFANNYASNCLLPGEDIEVDVLCAYRGSTRTMRIALAKNDHDEELEKPVSWSWVDGPTTSSTANPTAQSVRDAARYQLLRSIGGKSWTRTGTTDRVVGAEYDALVDAERALIQSPQPGEAE